MASDSSVRARSVTSIPIASIVPLLICLLGNGAQAAVIGIEFTPTDVGSSNTAVFTTFPTDDPALFLGADYGGNVRLVDFNTAPDGPLSEGGTISTQYSSLGVTMNNIRISSAIYGGNNYGTGFAAENDPPQIYSFSTPVIAVGIVNTSPDNDLVEFFSGLGATGTLLLSFRDQEGLSPNFDIDRFVGAIATDGDTIGSIRISNNTGNLELDELIFAVPEPTTGSLMGLGMCFLSLLVAPSRPARS